MAIHWIIPFRTLRSDQQLSVNVYDPDYTGTAVVLTGAAQPFETQEESSDDIFMPPFISVFPTSPASVFSFRMPGRAP